MEQQPERSGEKQDVSLDTQNMSLYLTKMIKSSTTPNSKSGLKDMNIITKSMSEIQED